MHPPAGRRMRRPVPYRAQAASPDPVWARRGCGMACLQMILAARGEPVPPLPELGRRCMRHGGYEDRPFGPLIYAGFVAFAPPSSASRPASLRR